MKVLAAVDFVHWIVRKVEFECTWRLFLNSNYTCDLPYWRFSRDRSLGIVIVKFLFPVRIPQLGSSSAVNISFCLGDCSPSFIHAILHRKNRVFRIIDKWMIYVYKLLLFLCFFQSSFSRVLTFAWCQGKSLIFNRCFETWDEKSVNHRVQKPEKSSENLRLCVKNLIRVSKLRKKIPWKNV